METWKWGPNKHTCIVVLRSMFNRVRLKNLRRKCLVRQRGRPVHPAPQACPGMWGVRSPPSRADTDSTLAVEPTQYTPTTVVLNT